jgi:competence protein ComEA
MTRAASLILAALMASATAASPVLAKNSHDKNRKSPEITAIDINHASAEEFEKLPGIGPELAKRIVRYREKHGPFRRIEDLMAVRGMGPKKWRAIRPYLRVDGERQKIKN